MIFFFFFLCNVVIKKIFLFFFFFVAPPHRLLFPQLYLSFLKKILFSFKKRLKWSSFMLYEPKFGFIVFSNSERKSKHFTLHDMLHLIYYICNVTICNIHGI